MFLYTIRQVVTFIFYLPQYIFGYNQNCSSNYILYILQKNDIKHRKNDNLIVMKDALDYMVSYT